MIRWQLAVVAILVGCGDGAEPRPSTNDVGRDRANVGQPEVAIDQARPIASNDNSPPDSSEEAAAAREGEADSIRPDYSKAVLTAGSRSLSPVRVRDRWPSEHLVGDSHICIRDATVESVNHITGEARWHAASQAGLKLNWLGQHHGVVFLADQVGRSKKDADEQTAPPTMIRRLKLDDGSWLTPLTLPLDSGEQAGINHVTAFMADGNGVIILSNTFVRGFPKNKEASYRITRFGEESTDVVWSNAYRAVGSVPAPGAFLLGSLGPARDSAAIQGLSRIGSRILVCAGPLEDLLAINPADGNSDWRVSRIWEYRRGFIGPSVWEYFLTRYGVEEDELEYADSTLEELKEEKGADFTIDAAYFEQSRNRVLAARERVEKQRGSIVGGPIVIASRNQGDEFNIFVATTQSESNEWPGYLSECVVYELSGEGEVIGTIKLPKFVFGAVSCIVDDQVMWRSEREAFAHLNASAGGGNADKIIEFEWRIARALNEHDAWFRHGRWIDTVVSTGTSMITVIDGGYVETETAQVYRFPITILDAKSYATTECMLTIPFAGRIPIPKSNFARVGGPDGEAWTTYSSFPLALSRLEIRGDMLVIGLENHETEHSLEFELASVIGGATAGK